MSKRAFKDAVELYERRLTPAEQVEFQQKISGQNVSVPTENQGYHDGYDNGFKAGAKQAFTDGYDSGWNAALTTWWKSMQRLNDDFEEYAGISSYTMGIAVAGFGATPKTMLKDLSGWLAEAVDRIKSDVRLVAQDTGLDISIEGLEAESDRIMDALKAVYSGEDSNGERLRAIAAGFNPVMQKNALIDRPALRPGRSNVSVIDRICDRVHLLHKDLPKLTRGEVFDQVQILVQSDPDAQDEYSKMLDWDKGDAFRKAYKHRYPTDSWVEV